MHIEIKKSLHLARVWGVQNVRLKAMSSFTNILRIFFVSKKKHLLVLSSPSRMSWRQQTFADCEISGTEHDDRHGFFRLKTP